MRAGLLALHKPVGISSRDCVNQVARAWGDKRLKAGHAGTLDPMATGVLLVAIGEATRLVEQLHELDKRYVGRFEFGKTSDTLDADGQVTPVPSEVVPTREQLESICRSFIGPEIMQRPPRVSAIKIQGQRAYDLARQGVEFEIEARPVAIHDVQLLDYAYPHFELELHCGSGTYVRSLGRDIAEAFGTSAIMTNLVRTAIGPFTIDQALPVDQLVDRQQIDSHLLSPLAGLIHWTRLVLDENQTRAIRNGRAIRMSPEVMKQLVCEQAVQHHGGSMNPSLNPSMHPDESNRTGVSSYRAVGVESSGQWIALLDIDASGHTRPVRVFQTMMATSQPNSMSARHKPES